MNPDLQTITDLFLKDSFTRTEALRRLRLFRQFLTDKIFASKPKSELISQEDGPWLESLASDALRLINKDNLNQYLDALEQTIVDIKPLVIFLPFELPLGELHALGSKIRSMLGPKFLIDIKLDPSLIAGCALVWGGVYKDFSIKAKIEGQRSEILDIFKTLSKR